MRTGEPNIGLHRPPSRRDPVRLVDTDGLRDHPLQVAGSVAEGPGVSQDTGAGHRALRPTPERFVDGLERLQVPSGDRARRDLALRARFRSPSPGRGEGEHLDRLRGMLLP